ncbi:MAG: fibronectin type III domain-containing protein, partial [Clostridiales bacterium]|nr:fibronectin type III domain-containing protein [Clostridiales bacterium]
SLTSVTISDGVVSIGDDAFNNCSNLVTVSISDSVTSIGKDAFYECSSLTQIYMGRNVASVGAYAFYECSKLTDIFYGGTEADWESIDIGEMDDTNYLLTATKYYEYDNSVSVSAPSISSLQGTQSGVKVSWKTVSGVTGYQVKYRIYRKSNSTVILDVEGASSSSTTLAGSESSKTYYVWVRAYKTIGEKTYYSPWSSQEDIYYKSLGTCTISSLANTSKGITVKWEKVSDALGYRVYRKTSGGSYSKIATVNSTSSSISYTDTSVKSKNGTTYSYYVVPYYSQNVGGYEAKTTVRLTGVSISSLKNVKTKKMTVKWGKNSKATGYQIQYSTSSSFSSYKTVTVTSYKTVSKTISKLTKGKKYYVRVRAYKTVSGTKYYSAWSSTKNVKISK